ncbi:hypothetical protein U1Q18_009320 [Sarracenia purpurea var. burkii]
MHIAEYSSVGIVDDSLDKSNFDFLHAYGNSNPHGLSKTDLHQHEGIQQITKSSKKKNWKMLSGLVICCISALLGCHVWVGVGCCLIWGVVVFCVLLVYAAFVLVMLEVGCCSLCLLLASCAAGGVFCRLCWLSLGFLVMLLCGLLKWFCC